MSTATLATCARTSAGTCRSLRTPRSIDQRRCRRTRRRAPPSRRPLVAVGGPHSPNEERWSAMSCSCCSVRRPHGTLSNSPRRGRVLRAGWDGTSIASSTESVSTDTCICTRPEPSGAKAALHPSPPPLSYASAAHYTAARLAQRGPPRLKACVPRPPPRSTRVQPATPAHAWRFWPRNETSADGNFRCARGAFEYCELRCGAYRRSGINDRRIGAAGLTRAPQPMLGATTTALRC